MKTHATIIIVFATAAIALAQAMDQASQPPQINVSGSAEVKVAPDEIYLRPGVETRHENLDDAKRQNDERIVQNTAPSAESEATLSLGQISVSATVNVSFLIAK